MKQETKYNLAIITYTIISIFIVFGSIIYGSIILK